MNHLAFAVYRPAYDVPAGHLGNSLQHDWVPYMSKMGYMLNSLSKAFGDSKVLEMDATFLRTPDPIPPGEYPDVLSFLPDREPESA